MYSVNNKNFSLAIRLEDFNGIPVNRPELFQLKAIYALLNRTNNGEFNLTSYYEIYLVQCTKDHFNDDSQFSNYKLNGLLCPVMNNVLIGGGYDQDQIGYLELKVFVCQEGQVLNDNITCGSNIDRIELLNQALFLSLYYQKTLINPNDYYNGIKSSMDITYFTLSQKLYKGLYLYFKQTKMLTDYGWLLESNQESTSLGLDSSNLLIEYSENLLNGELLSGIASVGVFFKRENDEYTRTYPKAQTLAAQVGGILKIFVEIGLFIVGRYNLCSVQLEHYNLFNKYNNTKGSKTKNFNIEFKNNYPIKNNYNEKEKNKLFNLNEINKNSNNKDSSLIKFNNNNLNNSIINLNNSKFAVSNDSNLISPEIKKRTFYKLSDYVSKTPNKYLMIKGKTENNNLDKNYTKYGETFKSDLYSKEKCLYSVELEEEVS